MNANELKPDRVIDGLDCCAIKNCPECPYELYFECEQVLLRDGVELIRKYKEVTGNGCTHTCGN